MASEPIIILRHSYPEKTTLGSLLIGGHLFCFTLEDELSLAIPAGSHLVEVSMSPKFGRPLPHIYSDAIPMKRGIRVHRGLHHGHSRGCVLVGYRVLLDEKPAQIAASAKAELALVQAIKSMGGRTTLEIVEVGRAR